METNLKTNLMLKTKTNLMKTKNWLSTLFLKKYLSINSKKEELNKIGLDLKAILCEKLEKIVLNMQLGMDNKSRAIPDRSITGNDEKYNFSFPLLHSVDKLELKKGLLDQILINFGIKKQDKNLSSMILSWYNEEGNAISNKYLNSRYKVLNRLKKNNEIERYWKHYFSLIHHSDAFFLANLSKWNPTWYKEYNLDELLNLRKDFINLSLNVGLEKEILKKTWVESPKGKFRGLSVPGPALRLYSHVLNNAINFLLRDEVIKGNHGFINGRGTLSAWKEILQGDLLSSEHIIQLDVSSGFPNLHKGYVSKYLLESKKLPTALINQIMQMLNLEVKNEKCPNEETQLEQDYNTSWESGPRGLPMGLGISPFLYTYTVAKLLEAQNLRWAFSGIHYADDLNFFISKEQWLCFIERIKTETGEVLSIETFYAYLNNLSLFQKSGLQFNVSKYSISKKNGIWEDGLSLLGLRCPDGNDIYANTKGRGENPVTKKKPTNPQSLKLSIENVLSTGQQINLTWLKTNIEYLGFFMSYLYNGGNIEIESLWKLPCTRKSIEQFINSNATLMRLNKKLITKVNMQNISQILMLSVLSETKVEALLKFNQNWMIEKENLKFNFDLNEKGFYFKKYSEIMTEKEKLKPNI